MQSVNRFPRQRFLASSLYAIAFTALLLTGWAGGLAVRHPDAGAIWSLMDGQVEQVHIQGPATGHLYPGDRILAINGEPVEIARLFPGCQSGDRLDLFVERAGQRLLISLHLAPPPLSVILRRLSPLAVGLVFWATGVVTLAFSHFRKQAVLFFLFCQVSSVTLVAGTLSPIGPAWTVTLFSLMVWWLGVLILHFHMQFPENTLSRATGYLIGPLYAFGSASSLLDLGHSRFQNR